MNIATEVVSPDRAGLSPVIARLRAATGEDHRRLEDRLDAVVRLLDPKQRVRLIRRYAALHIPAEAALRPHLAGLPGLDFEARCRAPLLQPYAGTLAPVFPAPHTAAEALGMFYVLEGSTLGGRMILRELESQGVADEALAFLDPYGSETGARWRDFLATLIGNIGDNEGLILQACRGGMMAFRHAESVLCEGGA